MDMKAGLKYLMFIVSIFLIMKITGCEPEDWEIIDCYDCFSYKPDSADLIIKLTINAENDTIPLIFYRGSLEEGVIDWIDTAVSKELRLYSEIGQLYTVKASYKSGNDKIIVIDSDKMHVVNADEECGYPCYIVKGGIFDLTLME